MSVLKFITTICKSSLMPHSRWLVKEKHRQPSGKGLTVQKYV